MEGMKREHTVRNGSPLEPKKKGIRIGDTLFGIFKDLKPIKA